MRTDENRWEPMGTDKNCTLGLLLLLDVSIGNDTERRTRTPPGTLEELRAESESGYFSAWCSARLSMIYHPYKC